MFKVSDNLHLGKLTSQHFLYFMPLAISHLLFLGNLESGRPWGGRVANHDLPPQHLTKCASTPTGHINAYLERSEATT